MRVLASGLVTAIGYNAPATLAALRAGVSGVQATGWVDLQGGQPIRGARVSLPHWWEGTGKLADLAAPAIQECLATLPPGTDTHLPILLGVSHPDRPGRPADLDARLMDDIHLRLELPLHPASVLFPSDQMGCMHALVEAARLMAEGRVRHVVVAGVDSFLSSVTLEAYEQRRRLLTAGSLNGFLPGEAGSAVLLGRDDDATSDGLRITGWGMVQETATIESTEPLRGVGLTAAIKQALAQAGVRMTDVAYRMTDLSGEHYKFKEAMLASMRLDRGPREGAFELWHPIEYLGEIGAAVLPCLLAWARHAHALGYAPGPRALCHLGSDDGGRAALVLQSATHQEERQAA
jgi:3-oxoacyl-[acyl-carrier-protein] synthase-1